MRALLAKLFSYLRSALQESKGVDSSVRLTLFIMTVTAALVVLVWLGLSVYVTVTTVGTAAPVLGLLPFALSTATAIGSLFGIAAFAKQWQYAQEPDVTPQPDPQPETPTPRSIAPETHSP